MLRAAQQYVLIISVRSTLIILRNTGPGAQYYLPLLRDAAGYCLHNIASQYYAVLYRAAAQPYMLHINLRSAQVNITAQYLQSKYCLPLALGRRPRAIALAWPQARLVTHNAT